jgi:hypothetical protein
MPLTGLFLLLGMSFASLPAMDGPKLTLQASTIQPYIGQIVRIDLRITYSGPLPSKPLTLRIPWLDREEIGFRWLVPSQQWALQQARVNSTDLRLVLGPRQIGAAREGNTDTFVLTWHVLMKEPDPLQPQGLRFGSVMMTDAQGSEVKSNELFLATRPLPVRPDKRGVLWLGIGDFQLEARLEPSEIRLGGECLLTLRVHGKGALAEIPVPVLSSKPGWKSDAFYLDPATEVWEEEKRVRCFRFRLHPRRARDELQLPQIQYQCFDPVKEMYIDRKVAVPRLRVRPPQEPDTSATATTPKPSEVPERLRFFPMEESATERLTWHSPLVLLGGFGPLGVILIAVMGRKLLDGWRWGRATTLAGRWAWRLLHDASAGPLPARAASALAAYFRLRFGLVAAEPTWEETAGLLQRHGLAGPTLDRLRDLFTMLDDMRFSPLRQAEEEQLLRAMVELFKEMERVTS